METRFYLSSQQQGRKERVEKNTKKTTTKTLTKKRQNTKRQKKRPVWNYPHIDKSARSPSAWDSRCLQFWLSWVWCVPGWASSSRSSGWPPQGGLRLVDLEQTPTWDCGSTVQGVPVWIYPQCLKRVSRTDNSSSSSSKN